MRQNQHRLAQADSLNEDIFTVLLFLQSNDVKLVSGVWLPPRAVHALLDLLSVRYPRPGIGARSERADARLHALHFLCSCAGLIAPLDGLLKPTPQAEVWIRQTALEQTRRLAHAVFRSRAGQAEAWWQRLHMPGWRVLRDRPRPYRPAQFSDLADALIQAGNQPVWRDALSALFSPAQRIDAHLPDRLPDTLLDGMAQLLAWMGIIQTPEPAAGPPNPADRRLTTKDERLLTPGPPFPVLAARAGKGLQLLLQAPRGRGVDRVRFLAGSESSWPAQYDLADLAPLVAIAPRTFSLDRDRVLRQFDLGVPVAHVVRRIARAVEGDLPRSVALLLHRWQRDHQRVRLSRVVLLETDGPDRLNALFDRRGIRDMLRRRIAPQHAIVRSDRVVQLTRRFSRMGLTPQRDFPLDTAARTSAGLDPEAHLYVCAAVMHQLADLLPLDYRAPLSLVAGLERGLTPAQRDGASDLVARLIGSLSRTAIPAEPLPPKTPARPLNPARRAARLTLAIERHETLVISYDTAGRGRKP